MIPAPAQRPTTSACDGYVAFVRQIEHDVAIGRTPPSRLFPKRRRGRRS